MISFILRYGTVGFIVWAFLTGVTVDGKKYSVSFDENDGVEFNVEKQSRSKK